MREEDPRASIEPFNRNRLGASRDRKTLSHRVAKRQRRGNIGYRSRHPHTHRACPQQPVVSRNHRRKLRRPRPLARSRTRREKPEAPPARPASARRDRQTLSKHPSLTYDPRRTPRNAPKIERHRPRARSSRPNRRNRPLGLWSLEVPSRLSESPIRCFIMVWELGRCRRAERALIGVPSSQGDGF